MTSGIDQLHMYFLGHPVKARFRHGLIDPRSGERAYNSAYACRDGKVLVVTKNRTLPFSKACPNPPKNDFGVFSIVSSRVHWKAFFISKWVLCRCYTNSKYRFCNTFLCGGVPT